MIIGWICSSYKIMMMVILILIKSMALGLYAETVEWMLIFYVRNLGNIIDHGDVVAYPCRR